MHGCFDRIMTSFSWEGTGKVALHSNSGLLIELLIIVVASVEPVQAFP